MLWWAIVVTAAAGPFGGVQTKVFGTQAIEVADLAEQGPVKILMAGHEGDKLKVDGWDFGTLPVETELAGGLHKFRVEGAAGVFEFEAVVHVTAGKVVEIDLASATAPPEKVEPTSVQGDKPELRDPTKELRDAAAEQTDPVTDEVPPPS